MTDLDNKGNFRDLHLGSSSPIPNPSITETRPGRPFRLLPFDVGDTVPYHGQDERETVLQSYDEKYEGSSQALKIEASRGIVGFPYGNQDSLSCLSDLSGFTSSGPGLSTQASLDDTGKINVSLRFQKALPDLTPDYAASVQEYAVDNRQNVDVPILNVVIFIVGSRGDVQPYLALALEMIRTYSHRVRIATHGEFKKFVLSANLRLRGLVGRDGLQLEGRLEFFNVGGDPKELMTYMVKNPGLMPGMESLRNGDISSKQRMTAQLLNGFFQSTFFPDNGGGPFAADAIVSNPPAFAHVHIAEALGLPLHMTFTMPWSATSAFSHPLVNIKDTNGEKGLSNYLSYAMADMLTWQGLGDVINSFRQKTLGLDKLDLRQGPSLLDTLKVPYTYCWSQTLIPQPKDWKQQIDISGFYFLESEGTYQPDPDLRNFLEAGEPPLYIGFGSVPVKDPKQMTETILGAVEKTGVRALLSAGWGGLGDIEIPKGAFIIKGNVPHDWLFAEGRVCAVCHHGGAGTTAIGLRNGLPTIVVPFFGDQQFWGDMLHDSGAGPSPISPKTLTVERLSSAILFCLSDDARAAARNLGDIIKSEDGLKRGVSSFHRHLPLLNMRCDVIPSRVALWWSDELCLRLSGIAAALLIETRRIDPKSLRPHRAKEYDSSSHHSDPLNGSVMSIFNVLATSVSEVTELFYKPHKGLVSLGWGTPKAALGVVGDLYEGFDNVPKIMGSDIRHHGRVDSLSSGIKEGGLGLFYGVMDGITGLVTEPYVGAKQEGVKGAIKGIGKSFANVLVRPAAGSLGLVVLPFRGVVLGLERKFKRTPEKLLHGPREASGYRDLAALNNQERAAMLARFQRLEEETSKRKAVLRRQTRRWLLTGEMTTFAKGIQQYPEQVLGSARPTVPSSDGQLRFLAPTISPQYRQNSQSSTSATMTAARSASPLRTGTGPVPTTNWEDCESRYMDDHEASEASYVPSPNEYTAISLAGRDVFRSHHDSENQAEYMSYTSTEDDENRWVDGMTVADEGRGERRDTRQSTDVHDPDIYQAGQDVSASPDLKVDERRRVVEEERARLVREQAEYRLSHGRGNRRYDSHSSFSNQ